MSRVGLYRPSMSTYVSQNDSTPTRLYDPLHLLSHDRIDLTVNHAMFNCHINNLIGAMGQDTTTSVFTTTSISTQNNVLTSIKSTFTSESLPRSITYMLLTPHPNEQKKHTSPTE